MCVGMCVCKKVVEEKSVETGEWGAVLPQLKKKLVEKQKEVLIFQG